MYFRMAMMVMLAVATVACDRAGNSDNVGRGQNCPITDYHNGVYYFECANASFGNALSAFKKVRPYEEVVAIVSNDTQMYGTTDGFFVIMGRVR